MLSELNKPEIEALLSANSIGRIGCKDGDTVYIVPLSYHYEQDYVHCHSMEGLKLDLMRANPEVCFEIEDIKDTEHWKTVICWGTFEEITDPEELARLRPKFVEWVLRKRVDLTVSEPAGAGELIHQQPKTGGQVFYRIHLKKFTGRTEEGF